MRVNPWVGKIPWSRKWQPAPVFLPGKFHGQWSLVGCSPWGYKELDITVQQSHTSCFLWVYPAWSSLRSLNLWVGITNQLKKFLNHYFFKFFQCSTLFSLDFLLHVQGSAIVVIILQNSDSMAFKPPSLPLFNFGSFQLTCLQASLTFCFSAVSSQLSSLNDSYICYIFSNISITSSSLWILPIYLCSVHFLPTRALDIYYLL